MENIEVNQEILRRYRYLYENKEIILSLCIKYETEEKYLKKCLNSVRKDLAKFKKRNFQNQEVWNILTNLVASYKEYLRNPRPYLMDEIPTSVLTIFEEFLIQDAPLEESTLFHEVESIKNDELELAHAEFLIEELRKRRKANQHLKNRNPFTVWRILNYVRNNNRQNGAIQNYLNIYYNLDRCITSGMEWESGYYLFSSDYKANEEFINSLPTLYVMNGVTTRYEESAVVSLYRGNEFEKEDEYFEQPDTSESEYNPVLGPKTEFVYNAIWGEPISKERIQRLYKELNGNTKKYVY